jgi:Xaa-Pro aminopeptidase
LNEPNESTTLKEKTVFAWRRSRVLPLLREYKDAMAEAFLTTALPNVRYLTGFTGSNGALLITPLRAILFTDPRYATQSAQQADCDVRIARGSLAKQVASKVKRLRLKSVAIELNRLSFADHEELVELLPGVPLKAVGGLVETLRMVKSTDEIGTIRASVNLNSAALEQALNHFKPNMSEIDLAAEIDYRMRLLGADGNAFDTIVASGKRSALPHAHPSAHPIEGNELLLIDMGSTVAGYASDMTRTFAVSKAGTKIRRMYKAVLESQLTALALLKPGVSCGKVDRAVRIVLRGYGFDKLFMHSTGHGLGLEIHERPRIGRKEAVKLEAGMTITIEPGVYDEGSGGIRIEDTVLITEQGCEVLTPTKKDLVVL